MGETLPVVYMKCAFCTAKNHCESCGQDLDAALERKPGILSAAVNVPEKAVRLEHRLDEGALEEALEDVGLLLG